MTAIVPTFFVTILLLLSAISRVESLIHHLVISHDHRNIFKIESFGFLKGGTMELDISDFHVKAPSMTSSSIWGKKATSKFSEREKEKLIEEIEGGTRHLSTLSTATATDERELGENNNNVKYNVGFILRHATSESAAQQDLEKIIDRNECIFDKRNPNDIYIDLSDPGNWKKLSFVHVIDEDNEIGFYSLIFAHCNNNNRATNNANEVNKDIRTTANTGSNAVVSKLESSSHYAKSFKLDVIFRNPGPDYLSAGDAPLPKLYFIFFLLYAGMMGLWMYVLGNKGNHKSTAFATPSVHQIHYVMLMLLTLKVLSLLFESIRYHYISLYGVSEGWSIVYYIFAGLKGIMLFTVILLIGSGYSLMKNYLSGHEKKVIYVVLILQVIDNIAMIILEETAPGSQYWLTWRDILHLVDVLCCLAILLPIVWSIRHLRQAAEVDGKAHNNLVKLQLFRQFYIVVVVYIYFTRIAVYLIESTMPFYLEWLGPFANELATMIFYFHTGYQFRPALNNPYLPVSTEQLEGKEYGLDDDVFDASMEIELAAPSVPRRQH